MERVVVWSRSRLILALLFVASEFLAALSSFAAQSVLMSWDPSSDTSVVGYNVYYGAASRTYTNMLVAGSATNIVITGLANGVTYYFAATAVDGFGAESDYSNEVTYSVPATNTVSSNLPPTITAIANQTVQENSSSPILPFVIGDPDTAVGNLTLTAWSSSSQLVPIPNIVFGGSGSNRTVQITPAVNQVGSASLTITVSDNASNSTTIGFSFYVQSTNSTVTLPPTIGAVAAQTIQENSSTAVVPFVIGDPDTPATSLLLSALSSNPQLVPLSNVIFGGAGSNRTVQVTPAANQFGSANVSVVVTDTTGNSTSTSFLLTVLSNSVVTPTITLITNGSGSITPNLAAKQLTVGKVYSAAAMPAAGQVFTGWSGTFSWSSPKLNFTLVPNTVLQANFIPSPYIPASGTYNGLFSEDAGVKVSSAGFFTASLTSGGTYSGRVQMANGASSFSGRMDLQCRATNSIKIGTNFFKLVLQAGSGSQAGHLSGYITDGNMWTATLQGDRAAFNAKTNPAPQAGTYTMMIHGQYNDAFLPAGHSFGSVKVSSNGIAKFAGTLADGTKISQSVSLSSDGLWPLFVPLYSGKGLMASWQTFETQADTDFDGDLVWIKQTNSAAKFYPNGFNYFHHVFGMTYTPPATTSTILNFTNAIVPFLGGDLAASFQNDIQILPGGKVANLSANKLSMTFSLSTGIFSGKVNDPTTQRTWSFSGAVLQKDNAGYGFLTGTNQTSQVALFPN
jgi:hypothetical protein